MDIRVEKTRHGIINAFIELRAHKDIERITIKELCEKAQINKSTFYSHYKDIYDLSDQLETEIVTSILEELPDPGNLLEHVEEFTTNIFLGYIAKNSLIQSVFSGSRSKFLIQKIERAVKDFFFASHPEYRDDPQVNIMLSFFLYGSYYAFYENRQYGDPLVIRTLAELTRDAGNRFLQK